MTTAILKVEEGQKKLAELEAAAGQHFHNSEEEFSRAIISLLEIQEEKLWEYSKDHDGVMLRDIEGTSFETYLHLFCDRYGTSRSSVQSYMGVGRLWKALGRPLQELIQIGVHRAKHVENLVGYDGRKNELKLPAPSVIAKLPAVIRDDDGEEPFDGAIGMTAEEQIYGEQTEDDEVVVPDEVIIMMVNQKIDEVLVLPPEPLTDGDVRDSFTIDVDENRRKTWFYFDKKNGDVWFGYETMDDMGDGKLMEGGDFEKLPQPIKDRMVSSLRIKTFS